MSSTSHKTHKNKTPTLRKERKVRRIAHRETGRKGEVEEGENSLFRFKGDLSRSHSYPFTLCHIGPWGGWWLLVIGAIHLSIRVLQDLMGSMLWSGNPQPRGTWDEVTTCLLQQQNHLHCLKLFLRLS